MNQTLEQVGEFGLIARIHEMIRDEGIEQPKNILGIGDDCAAFQPRPGYDLLVTCDCIVEDRHYLPRFISPYDLGRRAMSLNISDVGAMGGRPRYALISLGLRSDMPLRDVLDIYRGFLAQLNPFSAIIVGGNVTKSTNANFIDITLIGEVETGKMVRRSTAKPRDVILVTGYPGQSAAGLEMLTQLQPARDWAENPLVLAYQCPEPRAMEGHAVGQSGLASAMIDVSDGLLGDLGHICEESEVGAVLYEEKLPVSLALREFAERAERAPVEYVLKESDDYELILTCPPEHVVSIRDAISRVSQVPLTEIGIITPNRGRIEIARSDGTSQPASTSGWDHFSKKE